MFQKAVTSFWNVVSDLGIAHSSSSKIIIERTTNAILSTVPGRGVYTLAAVECGEYNLLFYKFVAFCRFVAAAPIINRQNFSGLSSGTLLRVRLYTSFKRRRDARPVPFAAELFCYMLCPMPLAFSWLSSFSFFICCFVRHLVSCFSSGISSQARSEAKEGTAGKTFTHKHWTWTWVRRDLLVLTTAIGYQYGSSVLLPPARFDREKNIGNVR